MTIAERIIAFLNKARSDRAWSCKELAESLKLAITAVTSTVRRMVDAGVLIVRIAARRMRNGQIRAAKYMLARRGPNDEFSLIDQRLVEHYDRIEQMSMVTRRCLCCRDQFSTTQNFRLCAKCRTGEAARGYDHPAQWMAVAA